MHHIKSQFSLTIFGVLLSLKRIFMHKTVFTVNRRCKNRSSAFFSKIDSHFNNHLKTP